ncbi:hypothetical protein LTR62_002223 [Meristemomyces frigidus]|uniref:Uncharacterized protein n=1 Tax=Meristemomyces frigidus TaxID=1508187 RepID=A0AAN7YLB3_9PEZI|nr:hypothetical protein LTR62_002223 [Meristemomyces frigidus]
MHERPLIPEEWIAPPRTKISTPPTWQPRDERAKIAELPRREIPQPIQLLSPPPLPYVDSPSPSQQTFHGPKMSQPRSPEIIGLAAPSTWPTRTRLAPPPVPPKQALAIARIASPSLYSRCSVAGQSDISYGILDYYTRDPSPLCSPDFPPPPVPKADQAMEKFDSGLQAHTPAGQATLASIMGPTKIESLMEMCKEAEVFAGAKRDQPLVDVSAPATKATEGTHKRNYSLFPAIKEVPIVVQTSLPGKASPTGTPSSSPTAKITSTPLHRQPDPSYRPRKESVTGSLRSREDSFTSFRSNRRIRLRILPSASTTSTSNRTLSTASSASNTPPEAGKGHTSRWSDDTITSPIAATTPGPRTSFGSLLRNVPDRSERSRQYPACFFEDDEDESMPLRWTFGSWRRGDSLTVKEIAASCEEGRARFDERVGLGLRLKRVLLCGGCGGGGGRRAATA